MRSTSTVEVNGWPLDAGQGGVYPTLETETRHEERGGEKMWEKERKKTGAVTDDSGPALLVGVRKPKEFSYDDILQQDLGSTSGRGGGGGGGASALKGWGTANEALERLGHIGSRSAAKSLEAFARGDEGGDDEESGDGEDAEEEEEEEEEETEDPEVSTDDEEDTDDDTRSRAAKKTHVGTRVPKRDCNPKASRRSRASSPPTAPLSMGSFKYIHIYIYIYIYIYVDKLSVYIYILWCFLKRNILYI